MNTLELSGAALDWAVGKCEGIQHKLHDMTPFSSDWKYAGPILDRECIEVSCIHKTGYTPNTWMARHPMRHYTTGPNAMVAAMRCYVASKLGYQIEVPEEVLPWEA